MGEWPSQRDVLRRFLKVVPEMVEQTDKGRCPLQSAYRKFYSTETAILQIHEVVLSQMDIGKVMLLTLLDLSPAVDTIDHHFLLHPLDQKIFST